MDFVAYPPGCGRSVTDFWGWDAHEAQLRYPVEVDGDYEYEVQGGAVNLNSTKLPPDHGYYGDRLLQGKFPMAEPGIESGSSWSVVRNSDH
jgi:hypothetical protein